MKGKTVSRISAGGITYEQRAGRIQMTLTEVYLQGGIEDSGIGLQRLVNIDERKERVGYLNSRIAE